MTRWRIRQTDAYKKRLHRFLRRHPDMQARYEKTILLLGQNPYHPSLRLHKLSGRFADVYSVSVSMQYRILLDLLIEDGLITLLDIGDHDEVYRS